MLLNHHSNTLSRCFYCSILLLRETDTEKLIWLLKGRARLEQGVGLLELGTSSTMSIRLLVLKRLCDSWNCCQIQFVNHARKSYSFIVMLLSSSSFNKSGIDLFILQAWLGVALFLKIKVILKRQDFKKKVNRLWPEGDPMVVLQNKGCGFVTEFSLL